MGKFWDFITEPSVVMIALRPRDVPAAAEAFAKIIEAQAKLRAAQHVKVIHNHQHIHVTAKEFQKLKQMRQIAYEEDDEDH